MQEIETYNTLKGESTGEYKEKGSTFMAFAYPISSTDEVTPIVKSLKAIHFKACHHCFSFRLGFDKNSFRANDDGEPRGTAGMPILGQIDSFKLTNTFVVVVRYYGGTNLGVPGLINAYKTATQKALTNATIITKIIGTKYKIAFDYSQMSDVMQVVKGDKNVEVISQDFNASPSMIVNVPNSLILNFMINIKAKVGHLHKEEIEEDTKIENLIITEFSEDA